MKKALILGCSHAAGSEMFKESGLVFNDFESRINYNHLHCYPAQIARGLGYDPINCSILAGSNDAMFRLFTEKTLDADDIVIACWTGVNRSEIYHKQWLRLCPDAATPDNPPDWWDDYFKQWVLYSANDKVGMLNKTKNILALNALAHARGVRVINIDSFWPVTDIEWPKSISWPVSTTFLEWCQQHQFPHTDWIHYFKPAHDSFAEHVLQNLSAQQISN
jgi:hypothetical protein